MSSVKEVVTDLVFNLTWLQDTPTIAILNNKNICAEDQIGVSLWKNTKDREQDVGEFEDYIKLSPGEKVNKAFTNSQFEIPLQLDSVTFCCNNIFDKAKLGKYLLKFASAGDCELISWRKLDLVSSNNYEFEVVFKNANPYALIGAVVAGIKDNSASLGKDAVLLDIKAIEKTPKIEEYINQFLERKR